jgi:hypothetical protein
MSSRSMTNHPEGPRDCESQRSGACDECQILVGMQENVAGLGLGFSLILVYVRGTMFAHGVVRDKASCNES